MNKNNDKLDYCRVKKIFENGFGFLSSLYYPENVFFHFSKIKDASVRKVLNDMKRGMIYVFYTSKLVDGKRKVSKLWVDVKKVEKHLIPKFTECILLELDEGKINPYELAYVIKLLRNENYLNKDQFIRVLNSPRIIHNRSLVKAILNEEELNKFDDVETFFNDVNKSEIDRQEWVDKLLLILDKK
jgi:cold shock CspA family protein